MISLEIISFWYILVYTRLDMLTTLFKSGNSVAVRIPKSIWAVDPGLEVEITREGDHLIVSPVRPVLSEVLQVFQGFDAEFMSQGREVPEDEDRSW